jgi:DNA repair exonuclease SbcCD ATPase subunit
VKLNRLVLRNFKGIREFTLDAQEGNIDVFGDNATGKTTIFDAFTWLLFDKDSSNKKDFSIKTLDKSGAEQHGLEHEVEATLDIDGQEITLRKVYKEKWTKKRGSAKAEFTGHTTDYFIDGVPVKKNEYDAQIAEIADEQIFRLLTDPRYFNEVLHWQKRRELLLQVCGDVTDDEVISSNTELSKLADILGNRTMEQHRKVIQARRTEINKELEKIPVRIDEVKLGLPDISDITDEKALPNDIAMTRDVIKAKQEELAQAKAGGQVAELTKKLRMIEGQMIEEKNRLTGEATQKAEEKRKELWQINDVISQIKSSIEHFQIKARSAEVEINNLIEKMKRIRNKWYAENEKLFDFKQDDTCPTCGQILPKEQLQATRDKALAQFNQAKAERLEAISAEGKQLAKRKAELEAELVDISKEIEKLTTEIPELESKKSLLQEELQAIQDSLQQITPSPEYIQLQKQCEELEEKIREAQADNSLMVDAIQQDIDVHSEDLEVLEKAAARLESHQNGLKRIEELKQQERDLAAEYERLEGELYLTEEFIRTKVNLLENRINSKFQIARFKLFSVLVNGAVEECCETTFNGVPYSNLNNGARLNVGLDIINTLSEHYGFAPVVFIDNAESVTDILPTKGQQIRLIVSEKDKALRVEPKVQNNLFKEAI